MAFARYGKPNSRDAGPERWALIFSLDYVTTVACIRKP